MPPKRDRRGQDRSGRDQSGRKQVLTDEQKEVKNRRRREADAARRQLSPPRLQDMSIAVAAREQPSPPPVRDQSGRVQVRAPRIQSGRVQVRGPRFKQVQQEWDSEHPCQL